MHNLTLSHAFRYSICRYPNLGLSLFLILSLIFFKDVISLNWEVRKWSVIFYDIKPLKFEAIMKNKSCYNIFFYSFFMKYKIYFFR